MKKLIVIVLIIALIFSVGMFSAVAGDSYNGNVAGIITSNDTGAITGHVSGAYELDITGQFTSAFDEQHATFNASISGDINGTITGGVYCINGLDTIYGEITGTGAADPVRIVGCFLQSGIAGDFAGEIITGALPAEVTDIVIKTADEALTVAAGSTLQCSAVTTPAGEDVVWAVWSPPSGGGRATIDQNGLLTALETGTVTVIANTLDPSLATKNKTITIVNPQTEVSGSVDPTYMIVIPAAVDFGTLIKDSGTQTQIFPVQAKGLVIEDGYQIEVSVSSGFVMNDLDGEGSVDLVYSLFNSIPTKMATGSVFSTFNFDRTENGTIEVNTADITAAGSYKGTMDFTISYVEE